MGKAMPIRYWHELSDDPEDREEHIDETYIRDSIPVFDRGEERPWMLPFRGSDHELDFD
jgi:hypothetical protein